MKKIIFGITILVIIALGYLIYNQKEKFSTSNTNIPEVAEENKFFIDLDGNGEKEFVIFDMPEDDQDNYLKSIKAYNQSGEEIATLPSEMGIKIPISDSFRVFKLNETNPEESFSLEFIAGPHQSETMFFGLNKDNILPICFKEIPEGPYDCLFYSGNVGYLPVKDLDGNGYVEIMEVVDEYPTEGKLNDEEEAAIEKAFNKEGVTEFTEGAEKIALREKGGRGKSVVWAIFSYNGKYFVPQDENNYEKYYSLIGELIKNKMKKSELNNDSLEYIEFVKDFWNGNPS